MAIGKTLRNSNFHKPVEEHPEYSSGWKCEDIGKGAFLGRGGIATCINAGRTLRKMKR